MSYSKNALFGCKDTKTVCFICIICTKMCLSAVMRSLRTQTHDRVWTVLVQVWFAMRFQFCSYCILIYIVNTSI